jgi:hypothetical protein
LRERDQKGKGELRDRDQRIKGEEEKRVLWKALRKEEKQECGGRR